MEIQPYLISLLMTYIMSNSVVNVLKKNFVTPKIVKMGYKENLNLKTRCLRLVFVLCSGPRHQAPVKLSVTLFYLPKMDLGLFSEPYR